MYSKDKEVTCETDIFVEVLSALLSRSLAFCSSYLNFEGFLCYLIPCLSEVVQPVLHKLRRGGNHLPPFFSGTEHMTFSMCCMILILPTSTLHADFFSSMMHDCDPVNMTGGLRSDTSVFPSSAVSPLQSVASLADLLTSSHARYSTERSLLL